MRPRSFALLCVTWMIIIFLLSSVPGTFTGPDIPVLTIIKKGLHFAIFGILSLLYLYTLKRSRPLLKTGLKVFLVSLFLTAIYAMLDEYHQSFTPGRHPSVYDVLIDTGGAITFLGTAYVARGKKRYTS
jgi:VanZ family protein